MALDWLAIIKTPVGWGLKKLLNIAGARYGRHKASERAMQGEDLASQGSLHHLVKLELERLAAIDSLPPGLQSDEFRNWLRQGENVELFMEVLIARAGNVPEMSRRAEEQLAIEFERVTHETRKLATGRVALAVSHIYGQLRATEPGRQALQLALEQWIAAQVFRIRHPEQRQFPIDADLARVRAMAATLLEAGKRSWKMPRFVAPLTLEVHERQEGQEPRPTSASELSSVIESGGNLILFGTGGIGKTTFLLDLCTSCINSERRIPLFVDAAVWGRTNSGLFEFLTGLPAAQANGVTAEELTKLAEAGRLVIMLNGWNEMSALSKLVCRDGLIQLTAAAEAISVVAVSRTSSDTPSLPNAKQIEVRGLTWQGQSAVIRAELGDDGSASLVDLLARHTRLRHAARSPLILRGLIAQARKGVVAYSSMLELLGAAVQAFEEDDQRSLVLSVSPVDGHQRAYLEEIACLLTQRLATNCSRDEALQAIHSAAARLAERQLVGALPRPTSVLDVLVSHHLLHLDDGVVRFAHQRFQEYFAATRVLRECIEDAVPPTFLRTAVNQPAWSESLVLVAGKLKAQGGPAAARVRMVKAAVAIDLGVACDLAGISSLSYADDSELHQQLVSRVNELAASAMDEVRDLGVAYQIASGLPAFAERLWPLLESEDQQTRLHTYRLNGSAISLAQLGAGAAQRVASWPPDLRVEFVHEMADNADNYEFLVSLARHEPDPAVRTAAISALFWHFPASDVPLQAWLDAPVEVQIEHNLMSHVQYALEDGYAGDAVRKRLLSIAASDTSDNAQLQLALALPNEVGPRALDVVFKHLHGREHHGNDAPLVAIARTNAPERLLNLARQLAVQSREVPEWVSEYLQETSTDVKTDVFEQAWIALQGQDFKKLSGEVLGPLADRNQIERSVTSWLEYGEAGRGTLSDIDHERHRQVGYLLAHVPGGDLLNVVMQRGQSASYNEAAQLVDLVLRRMGRDDGSARMANQWQPTVDAVRQLVAQFAEKVEAAEVPQDTVRVYLCGVASHVAPAEFGSFLMETCRRHLDAWSTFREKVDQCSKMGTLHRPHNPQEGLYLASALAKWGADSLPGLLELMAHPSAMEFVPEAIVRIVSLPWASQRERLFSSLSTDIQEGDQRRRLGRELRQPDDTFQHWTDESAKAIGQRLSKLVTTYEEKKSTNEKWNAREAEHYVGRLAGIVASIPSAGVVEPVHRALTSGLMDVYGTVGALRGLVRQGLYISDTAVVRQLEAQYDQAANTKWYDDSTRYAMSGFSELLIRMVPLSLLSKPIGHYLQQWRRFSYPNEIIRHLGAMHSEAAWPALLEIGGELVEKARPPEELGAALVSALTPRHLTEFLALVANGTLLAWCGNEWTLERLAPSIAAVLGERTGQVEDFLDACRQTRSSLADRLAGEVLSHIKGSDEARQSYLLEALDAGRAIHPNMSAFRMLRGMFTLKVPIDDTQYDVIPKASNELRAQLYLRARGAGPTADGCRRLLASLECGRRENARPDDEPRHPAPEDGLAWTDALSGPQVTH
ncbi:NACHT domain-containing protein [Cupriavidus sp. CuC1]|uniref:NACHT domain-containing protein n=1 Tax=Cupriavidus sp. CuC1 TaxID=3373131 RepID=UPI0037D14429